MLHAMLGFLAVVLSVTLCGERLVGQEPIGPGTATRLPAHTPDSRQGHDSRQGQSTVNPFAQRKPTNKTSTNETSSTGENLLPGVDPLRESRQSMEEQVLRQERANAATRARFESRSLDRIPKMTPTTPEAGDSKTGNSEASTGESTTEEEAAAAARFDREVDRLPPPPLETDDAGLDAPRGGVKDDNDILSPSDLPLSQDRDLDLEDLLTPPSPNEGKARREPERKIPAPLKRHRDSSSDRPSSSELPSRLGGDALPPLESRSILKAQPTEKSGKWTPSQNSESETESASRQAEKKSPSKHAHSVLDPPADPRYPNAPHWTGLIEDEQGRWPAPASFRPSVSVSPVTCSACGGCVDRQGVGFCDKLGVCVGVGTREKPACQCWRCPHERPFNSYGPGGYAGPARAAPLPEYRLRAGDQIQLTFLIKTIRTVGSYRLVVGDELLIESDADENLTRGTLDRGLEIQPDGTLTLRFIGQVHAAGQTIQQLRDLLNERYEEYYPDPAIDVTPVQTGNVARQIREAISGSEGFNPQQTVQTVTPEGTIRLPRLGAIPTQGLTLAELKREINLRYDSLGAGMEVEVNLEEQAPHYVYVLGEVATPGRFEIDTPTTVLGSLSLAGSYVPGANLRQIVVFRRGPNWELLSTMLDLRAALLGKASRPPDEIWVQDGDVIIVPPAPIRLFDRFVSQVFTEGIYGIVPFGGVSFSFGDNN